MLQSSVACWVWLKSSIKIHHFLSHARKKEKSQDGCCFPSLRWHHHKISVVRSHDSLPNVECIPINHSADTAKEAIVSVRPKVQPTLHWISWKTHHLWGLGVMETSTWQAAHFFCPSTRDGIVLPNAMMTWNVKSRPKWIWFLQHLFQFAQKTLAPCTSEGRKNLFPLNVANKGLNVPTLWLYFKTHPNGSQMKRLNTLQVFWVKGIPSSVFLSLLVSATSPVHLF